MTIFSLATTWGMYEISTLYNPSGILNNYTQQRVHDLAGNYSSISNLNNGQNPNPALIFGDFITGVTVLLNALAIAGNAALGGGLVSILQGLPNFDQGSIWLVQILYGSSEVLLWIYVVANRSL